MNFQMIQAVIKCFERSTVERIEENSNDVSVALFIYTIMYQSNRSLNIPPGATPGHLNFCSNSRPPPPPPPRGRKAVQMRHCKSISVDQMPPPSGNFSVASYYAPEAVYVNMVYRQHSYMPKIIQMVLEYLQIQSKACGSLCFSASPP